MFKLRISLLVIIGLCAASSAVPAMGQVDLTVRGSGKLFPIGLPQLCVQAGQSDAVREIPRVMARDLDISGFFEVLNANSYIETPGKCDAANGVSYSDWSVIGAEGLVKGVITVVGGTQIRVQLYLHDVQRQQAVLGKEYSGDLSQAPKMAHKFANEIMKFFTGTPGVFGTQIAYSSKVGRFKELFVMDMDGSNIRQITDDRGLAMSAAWSPNGRQLVFSSFKNRIPDLFRIDVDSRRVQQVTNGIDLEVGPEFSKRGDRFLVSISKGTESSIVLMNQNGQIMQNLSRQRGVIDVSPEWSPDESKIAFTSNRTGNPQIYVMNADGSDARRISFVSSNYCTSPAWSPKGDKLAFVCRADSGFQLFVANPDGSSPLQLTSYGSNEDPSFSPNGEYITFATTFGKRGPFNIALIRPDGSNLRQLTYSKTDDTQPAWSPSVDF